MDPLCRRVLSSYDGAMAPCHIFGDIQERLPADLASVLKGLYDRHMEEYQGVIAEWALTQETRRSSEVDEVEVSESPATRNAAAVGTRMMEDAIVCGEARVQACDLLFQCRTTCLVCVHVRVRVLRSEEVASHVAWCHSKQTVQALECMLAFKSREKAVDK